MNEPKKLAALLRTVTATEQNQNSATSPRWRDVLAMLYRGSMNRFEAERVGDHCLNSTIPEIEKKGVAIFREWEVVPCLGGKKPTRVCRYRVESSGDNMSRARDLLGFAPDGR